MANYKELSPEGVAAALVRAKEYRYLNDPELAESICLDIIHMQPNNQDANRLLLLAETDQFGGTNHEALNNAKEALSKLTDPYQRAYYGGLISERYARWMLKGRGQRSHFVAHEAVQDAIAQYEEALKLKPEGNDEAILRWNTCQRMIKRYRLTPPDESDRQDMGLE